MKKLKEEEQNKEGQKEDKKKDPALERLVRDWKTLEHLLSRKIGEVSLIELARETLSDPNLPHWAEAVKRRLREQLAAEAYQSGPNRGKPPSRRDPPQRVEAV